MNYDKLPIQLINQLNKNVQFDTSKFKYPLEAIMSEKVTAQQIPATIPTVPMISIDGFILPGTELTLLMYIIITKFANDPEVERILKQFNFKFYDVNGRLIYPKKIGKRKSGKSQQ